MDVGDRALRERRRLDFEDAAVSEEGADAMEEIGARAQGVDRRRGLEAAPVSTPWRARRRHRSGCRS